MKKNNIICELDKLIPNPRCELEYTKDYELLLATMLSAQCTDKRVNMVTGSLFKKYDLNDLANLDINIIEKEIKSLGSYTKKAFYLKEISKHLIAEQNGKVPNDRAYLESLPGVGRKTTNVVLGELFNVPTIAVDTHVERVSKRLGIAKKNDNVRTIENKLMKLFDENEFNRVNHQILLFGRYYCTAVNPKCDICPFNCKQKVKK